MTPITVVVKGVAHFVEQSQHLFAHPRGIREAEGALCVPQQSVGRSNAGRLFDQHTVRCKLHQVGFIRTRSVSTWLDFYRYETSAFLDQVIGLANQTDPARNQWSFRRPSVGVVINNRRPRQSGCGTQAQSADQRNQRQQEQRQPDGNRHGSARISAADHHNQRSDAEQHCGSQQQTTQRHRSGVAVVQSRTALTPFASFRFQSGDTVQPPGSGAVHIFTHFAGADRR